MTVKEFWESDDELAIHCNSEEKAEKLLKEFDKLGKKWNNNKNYLDKNNWEHYKGDTCYGNDRTYSYLDYYEIINFRIIEFDDLEDFKPKSKYLDDVEYNYLLNIIKPFMDRVEYIQKSIHLEHEQFQFIVIGVKSEIDDENTENIYLPCFKVDTMYKDMKVGERYSLEELGFVEPKKKKTNGELSCNDTLCSECILHMLGLQCVDSEEDAIKERVKAFFIKYPSTKQYLEKPINEWLDEEVEE